MSPLRPLRLSRRSTWQPVASRSGPVLVVRQRQRAVRDGEGAEPECGRGLSELRARRRALGEVVTMVNANAGDGPVVMIVGGSSGIGRATALEFAKQGAAVTLVARGRPALESAAKECLGAGARSADVQVADVGDIAGVKAAVDAILAGRGRIDVVVHAATVMAYGPLEALDEPVFEQVIRTAI